MVKTAKRNGYIEIKGARENNLKNIDVLIPQNRFTVVTGLSGSGKSSLVLDTVYKEDSEGTSTAFQPTRGSL